MYGRTTCARNFAASVCFGLITTLNSSGTITDGTRRSGAEQDFNQSVPSSMLLLPGGSATQSGSKSSGDTFTVPSSATHGCTSTGQIVSRVVPSGFADSPKADWHHLPDNSSFNSPQRIHHQLVPRFGVEKFNRGSAAQSAQFLTEPACRVFLTA